MRILFTFILAAFLYSYSSATVLTVCPNSSFPAQFSTIHAAIDSASASDTIYIYPGTYPEDLTVTKQLVLIGPGINPHRPSKLSASVWSLTLTGSNSSGSVIMGLYIYFTTSFGSNTVAVNNLLVNECYFRGGATFNGYNNIVENCILSNHYPDGTFLNFEYPNAVGNIIQNCYIHGYIALRPGTNTLIRNNIFASGDASTNAFSDIQFGEALGSSVLIENNIFFKSNPLGSRGSAYACEFKNNIYYLTNNPVPENSLSSGNLNADPLFVNYPAGGNQFSFEYDYQLQASSPGIKYGSDGKDVGMWDGLSPVNAGFEPPIPRIYELKVDNAKVPAGGTIQLTIKATKAQ